MMSKQYKKESYLGFCPFLQDEHSIFVTYQKIQLAGWSAAEAKPISYECDYSSECKRGNCPIFTDCDNGIHLF